MSKQTKTNKANKTTRSCFKVFLMLDAEKHRTITDEEMAASHIYVLDYTYHRSKNEGSEPIGGYQKYQNIRAISGYTLQGDVVLIPISRIRVIEIGYLDTETSKFHTFGYPHIIANMKYSSEDEIEDALVVAI